MVANIKKGDSVIAISGKDKGKKGKVLKVFPGECKVLVSGLNMVKRHTKPSKNSEGGIIEKEAAVHISNVAHVDPKDGKATRIGVKVNKDGAKVRFYKRSGTDIVS